MKSNTLAVALAALLVGGVATAGYMNSRGDSQPAPVAAPLNASADILGPNGEPLPLDAAIPASGRLEYADVLDVTPITEREPLYATVIGSEPVRETSTTSSPQEVCEDVVVQERMPERDGNVGGTVAGALIGGLVGNQVGGGDGRKVATAAGAAAGGYIGNRVDRRHVGGRVVQTTERQCHTVTDTVNSSKVIGYDVTFRNPDGSTGMKRMTSRPGSRISLGSATTTTAYDVTYTMDGEERVVRMDERPSVDRFRVVDGEVITKG